jgi:dTDP-4-amino-4,6-dideoxygalactose transaminase
VVTGDEELACRMRVLRDHGQKRKYQHSEIGWNCRMDGIQAAVLSVKLAGLDYNNDLRTQHATKYSEALRNVDHLILPVSDPRGCHVNHLYVARVPDRIKFIQHLKQRGIETAIHYPLPVHLLGPYSSLGYSRGSFPISERCAEEFVSLPMYPELSCFQTSVVIDAVAGATGAVCAT